MFISLDKKNLDKPEHTFGNAFFKNFFKQFILQSLVFINQKMATIQSTSRNIKELKKIKNQEEKPTRKTRIKIKLKKLTME